MPDIIPQGNFHARITAVNDGFSRSSGRPMLTVSLQVPNHSSTLKYYIVFNSDNQDTINRTNFYLKKFCDAFNLNPADLNIPNFNFSSWIGAEGGIIVEHEENNGQVSARVKNVLSRQKFAALLAQSAQQQQQQQNTPQQQNQSFGQPAMNQNGIISF